jgi:uncharacterized iron-regulated membrane protein
MKRLRKIIFWCHLFTGTIAGLVVFIMSVTGIMLTYEKQMTFWADTRSYQVVPPSNSPPRLSIETLLAKTAESRPQLPSSITMRADPLSPASIGFQGGTTLFINPYTGEALGEGAPRVRAFFRAVTDWHRWLGRHSESRNVARAVTGACNLGFLFLVTSGFYLWWPSKWTKPLVKNVTWFKRGLKGRARNFNWHNVIGFWCAVPLFIVVLSAVVISYTWASNLVYRLAGEAPPAPRSAPAPSTELAGQQRGGKNRTDLSTAAAGLDLLWLRAEQQVVGWKSISLQVPSSVDSPVTFTIDQGSGGQPQKRAQLVLDRKTGDVVRWEPFSSLSRGRQARSILRFAHTGEVAGFIGQTIAGIVSIGATFLVWTGLSLSWRRFRGWRRRRSGVLA